MMMNKPTKPTRNAASKLILPGLLGIGLALFFLTGTHKPISWQAIAQNYGTLQGFVTANPWLSYLLFMLLYCVVVAFSLPIALPLTLTGGAVLGWPAIGLVVVGATMGAGVVFIAAKSLFTEFLRARAGPFMAKLEAGFNKNAFSYLLALRLIPAAPFWVVNIVPALTNMRLAPFLLATLIGITPGSAVFVSVGRGFDHILAAGQTPDVSVLTSPPILLPLAGLGVLALLPIAYRRFIGKDPNQKGDPHKGKSQ